MTFGNDHILSHVDFLNESFCQSMLRMAFRAMARRSLHRLGGPGHVNAQRLEMGFGNKVVGQNRLTYNSTIHLKYEGGTMLFLPRILSLKSFHFCNVLDIFGKDMPDQWVVLKWLPRHSGYNGLSQMVSRRYDDSDTSSTRCRTAI